MPQGLKFLVARLERIVIDYTDTTTLADGRQRRYVVLSMSAKITGRLEDDTAVEFTTTLTSEERDAVAEVARRIAKRLRLDEVGQ